MIDRDLPLPRPVARLLRAAIEALRRFNAKGGWVLSSHVAMSIMLALFPFILFVVALGGFLSGHFDIVTYVEDREALNETAELIFGAWPDAIQAPIVAELRRVLAADNTSLMTVGGLLTLFFASNGVDAVREAMTRAYHDIDTRPYWKTRALCLAFVLLGAVAVLAAGALAVAGSLYTRLAVEQLDWSALDWLARGGFGVIVIDAMPVIMVLAAHYWLPARRHSLRQILPGVVLTILGWMAAGRAFSWYVAAFGSYSATYAGLAGAMAALIFLYLISAILILGAEFNGALIDMSDDTSAE